MVLNLPSELRLEIYTHCTAYSLLLLSQTCRLVRAEILSSPHIFTKSYGYSSSPRPARGHRQAPYPNRRGGILTIHNITSISGHFDAQSQTESQVRAILGWPDRVLRQCRDRMNPKRVHWQLYFHYGTKFWWENEYLTYL
ncbi:hypothetical protein BJ508DRAFT_326517 [Ascobolus immersus RN42]|uniref:F-box domain-containing protein n=1 Tax=Ascobolus immersus RN42 TaxID=1160509 RepID=A0A3N4IIB1_ASCIM|nr:hypothetical protein BJ508DRAFT_326517 [Ascobolus immersus RN42]